MSRWQAYVNEAQQRLYEWAVYGNRRQRKISLSDFKQSVLTSPEFRPVFFLSTGRTGTQLFTQLLNQCPGLRAFHTPKPELIQQGKVVYEAYRVANSDQRLLTDCLAGQLLLAARERYLYQSFLHQKTYVETNNRITFLAPAIRKIIPHTRFVFLYRHPGEFIRSGLRRRWYSGQTPHDIGRITNNVSTETEQRWNEWDSIQKIAWLWNETNRFAEDFLASVDPSAYLRVNFSALTEGTIRSLLEFADGRLSDKNIAQAVNQPVNKQQDGHYPPYEAWPEADKEKVRKLCRLAPNYGYTL